MYMMNEFGVPDYGMGMEYGGQPDMMQMQQMSSMMPAMPNPAMMNDMSMLQGCYNSAMVSYDSYGIPKVNKRQCIEMMKQNLLEQYGVFVTEVVKIPETPDLLRHACLNCGISFLPRMDWGIQWAGFKTDIYFCTGCGKLYIPQMLDF